MSTTAWSPGSVTTVFVPRADAEGSLGVSFAVADGVTATLEPATATEITLDGDPTSFEPVEGLLDSLECSARVHLESAIPVGRGFGASGAATLATALAAGEAFDLAARRSELVNAAHRAELAAGTGQGDVFVQDSGGLVYNTGEGIGRRERSDPIAYAAFEGIETAGVLGDEQALERITAAGQTALEAFDPEAPLDEWFPVAWDFAQRTGLVTEDVSEAVREVSAAGGAGTMAMVGETVIATGDSDVLDRRTAITPRGARVED
jgi:pantoate kinase